jgi:UPF0755 protein
MSRHGEQETDGGYSDGTWLPGGFGEPANRVGGGKHRLAGNGPGEHQQRGSGQSQPGRDSNTGPPWEEVSPPGGRPGWDRSGTSPVPGPADLAGGHPSGPLPVLPSLPAPAQQGDWPEPPPALGYAGVPDHGYPDNGHARYSGPGGAGYPGADYADGGYGGHDDTGYGDTGYAGTGYASTGYEPGGYRETDNSAGFGGTSTGVPTGHAHRGSGTPAPVDDYPEPHTGFIDPSYIDPGSIGTVSADTGFPHTGFIDTGFTDTGFIDTGFTDTGFTDTGFTDTGFTDTGFTDTGTGYVVPGGPRDGFTAGAGGYLDDGDYPAGDDEYLAYGEHAAGRHDRDDDHGFPDRGGWYGEVDEQQGWAEDDDEHLLPGLSTDTRRRGESRRPGGTGPGREPTGRRGTVRAGGGEPGSGPAKGVKRRRSMRRLAPWLAVGVLLALLVGAGGGYLYVYRTYLHPPDFAGPGTKPVVVRIYPGDSASTVGQRLQRLGVVASARAFANAAKASGRGSALEPGFYRMKLHMQAALAFALLLKPSAREQTRITIPEGQRLSQVIATLGRATGNERGYQQAIKDVAALNLPSFANGKPEGYLFPATYEVQPNTPPIKVLQAMVTRFGQEAASVSLPSAAAHAELTQAQVIVVASLIQAEGRHLSDFPKIAEVIYKRLNSNTLLQLDSTVMYALHTRGIRATAQQLKVRSPYNTYVHKGLPPGPIDSPGDAAIRAALHPAHGNLMYFVTVDPKTGLTKFTSSFTQFQQFEAELTSNLAKGR